MDIIIFSGQSNMQGQTECLSENETVCGAHEYKWLTDELVPLKNPVGENITYDMKEGFTFTNTSYGWAKNHALGSACYGHTNMVPSFCRTYKSLTNRDVIAVHAAKGSSVIADWMPGSPIYDILIKKALGAKKKSEADHIFFVWLQGESDAIMGNTKAYYKNALAELCRALKADIGIEKFGIIRVGRFVGDTRDDEIISAQDEICKENSDFIMLTNIATELNKMPEFMHPQIGGHYSAKGLEKLGSEGAKTLAASIFGTNK